MSDTEEHRQWYEKIAKAVHRTVPAAFELDDLVQVARTETWKQLSRFDPEKGVPFQGFAYRAVRGACLMQVRRRAWKEAHHEELPDQIREDRGSVLLELQQQSLLEQVRRNIRWVRYPHRVVIHRHFIRGWKMTSIARMLHVGVTTVYTLRQQGIEQIRQRIRSEGNIPEWWKTLERQVRQV